MIGAVDIGGTKFAVGMFDHDGHLLARAESPCDTRNGPENGIKTICDLLSGIAARTPGVLEGIGIGCTGPVDPSSGILGQIEFLPGWQGINLVEKFQDFFGVSTVLENDADAAALGEHAWGAGQGSTRFVYVTISTGIGSGVVLNGHLYRGVEGSHPEVGHHIIDPSGPQCSGCGASGCWECLASGPALARRAGYRDARETCQAAEAGIPVAVAAVQQVARYMGVGLANIINMFVPDILAIGGGVMQSRHLFWRIIERTIQENCGLVPHKKTHLVPSRLGRNAGLAGAACVWVQRSGRNL